MLSEGALQLTVWILGSNGISRFAWERDAFLVDGAHFELVEMPRPESLHSVIQVVGVGLKDQVGEQRFRTVRHNLNNLDTREISQHVLNCGVIHS